VETIAHHSAIVKAEIRPVTPETGQFFLKAFSQAVKGSRGRGFLATTKLFGTGRTAASF
jgi:hypothetical protein